MLQNAYLVAKIGADKAENEQHFAEILPIGRRVADRSRTITKMPQGMAQRRFSIAIHPIFGFARRTGVIEKEESVALCGVTRNPARL